MIKELSELGKTLRAGKADGAWVHDALKEEVISMVLTIRPDGSFASLLPIENKKTMAEAIQRTSGKEARLLLDNCGYALGVYDPNSPAFKKKVKDKGEQKAIEIFEKDVGEKRKLFVGRIMELQNIDGLNPVIKFYEENSSQGIGKMSQEYFLKTISKKARAGNIAILISGGNQFVHELDAVYSEIINKYETIQSKMVSTGSKKCSVCLESSFPVGDYPHFPIKGVPGDKEPAGGRKLISYNGDNNPFESYGMTGNENCMICNNCAKTYVEGLNWLLSTGNEIQVTDKKGKSKPQFRYTNRKNFGADTAMVFWTRNNQKLDEIDLLDAPSSDEVAVMVESLAAGNATGHRYLEPERFYSCTLSGAAARIAVRDWIETSLGEFRASIAKWFKDIAIGKYDTDFKKIITSYAPLYSLARSCQRQRMKSDGSYEYDKDDPTTARVAVALWKAALHNASIPTWILSKALQRARYDVSTERAALIKLILMRNLKGGGSIIMENSVQGEKPIAYICGQIFAKMESIQYAALGEKNAGIREKYFTYAMTTPAAAFGRLFNLSSKHFSKLKHEKPGLAVNMDKELQELCSCVDIDNFPIMFRLEEQGQFAIGYYHQKQKQYANSNKKLGGMQ